MFLLRTISNRSLRKQSRKLHHPHYPISILTSLRPVPLCALLPPSAVKRRIHTSHNSSVSATQVKTLAPFDLNTIIT